MSGSFGVFLSATVTAVLQKVNKVQVHAQAVSTAAGSTPLLSARRLLVLIFWSFRLLRAHHSILPASAFACPSKGIMWKEGFH